MSREKFSWPCTAAAWRRPPPPARRRRCRRGWPPARPGSAPARLSSVVRWLLTMPRAMWRCVTCVSSCASTEASSSRVAGDRDQAQVHADEAAGQREGVDAAVAHQEDFPGEAAWSVSASMSPRWRAALDQRLPDALQVLQQQRVVQVGGVAPDLAHDLLAQAALGADAEVLAEPLRPARAGAPARRPRGTRPRRRTAAPARKQGAQRAPSRGHRFKRFPTRAGGPRRPHAPPLS